MDQKIGALLENWLKRGIQGIYCADKKSAAAEILRLIPKESSIGISGSVTLNELGIADLLESRGNRIFNQYKPGLSRGESLELRKQGVLADYYLASANAIAQSGEMVFISAYGNRISGVSHAANVLIICGINKITPDLDAALKRAKEYATPLNCKRLNWNSACLEPGTCRQGICLAPEYRRMCCQTLIVEAEAVPDRLKVILVGESLGY